MQPLIPMFMGPVCYTGDERFDTLIITLRGYDQENPLGLGSSFRIIFREIDASNYRHCRGTAL